VRGQSQEQALEGTPSINEDIGRQRAVVRAFLVAARAGDFAALLTILDPEVVCRADAATVAAGAQSEIRGAGVVAKQFAGRARAAQPALINGVPGLVWAQGGAPRVVFSFTICDGKIAAIEMIGEPTRLQQFDLRVPDPAN
jgi:RNA polymerase sigma-70 factor (ECF subfamily)